MLAALAPGLKSGISPPLFIIYIIEHVKPLFNQATYMYILTYLNVLVVCVCVCVRVQACVGACVCVCVHACVM